MGVGIEKYLVKYIIKFGFGIVFVIIEENIDFKKLVIEGVNNLKMFIDIIKEIGICKVGKEKWK